MFIIGKIFNLIDPLIVIALLFLGIYGFFYSQTQFPHLALSEFTGDVFKVEKGDSLSTIASNLKNAGLIGNKYYFIFYVFGKKSSSRLQAGEYLLNSGMSVQQIADKIIKGDTMKIRVTPSEGFSLQRLEDSLTLDFLSPPYPYNRLIKNGKERLWTVERQISQILNFKIRDFQDKYSFFQDAPSDNTLEGFLFPDTYKFPLDASPEDIARIMLDNFDKKLTLDLREEIQRQNRTIYEIITMASLVEKEVRTKEDMGLASGIMWKRLEIGMPLQVDATVVYLTGKKSAQVTFEDLKIDSPYNTYLYKGLPLGPISNPGLQAIKAAIYPEESDYLYYLSKPDGETVFSKTLTEHNLAKAKYLNY